MFDTTDSDTFPTGDYKYIITVTIGTKSVDTEVTVTLHPGCGEAELEIVEEPPISTYHFIGDSSTTVWTYDISTIISSSSNSDCGEPVVTWVHTDGSSLNSIFTNQCEGTVCTISCTCD